MLVTLIYAKCSKYHGQTADARVLERADFKVQTDTNDSLYPMKGAFFGHLQRRSPCEFPRLILKGLLTEQKAPGRPKTKWFDDIKEWTRDKYSVIKTTVHDCDIFLQLTADLKFKDGTK